MGSLSLTSVRVRSKQNLFFKVLVNKFHLKMTECFLPGNLQRIQAELCFQFHNKLRLSEFPSVVFWCQFQLWLMLCKILGLKSYIKKSRVNVRMHMGSTMILGWIRFAVEIMSPIFVYCWGRVKRLHWMWFEEVFVRVRGTVEHIKSPLTTSSLIHQRVHPSTS